MKSNLDNTNVKDCVNLFDDPQDNINHPHHYNSSRAKCSACEKQIECIDIVRHLEFNIGNAIKYLWRYKEKNGKEDLKKAIWYINDEINKYINE
jgi:hypothetical protein